MRGDNFVANKQSEICLLESFLTEFTDICSQVYPRLLQEEDLKP
jgi:hypothetical protein